MESSTNSIFQKNVFNESFFNNKVLVRRINRFVRMLRDKSQQFNYMKIGQVHFDIIGDKGLHCGSNKRIQYNLVLYVSNAFKQFDNVYGRIFSKLPVINPDMLVVILFQLYYASVLVVYIFAIPIVISFGVQFSMLNRIVFNSYLGSIFVSMNKGIYVKGKIVMDRKIILMNYFKKCFFLDAILLYTIVTANF